MYICQIARLFPPHKYSSVTTAACIKFTLPLKVFEGSSQISNIFPARNIVLIWGGGGLEHKINLFSVLTYLPPYYELVTLRDIFPCWQLFAKQIHISRFPQLMLFLKETVHVKRSKHLKYHASHINAHNGHVGLMRLFF